MEHIAQSHILNNADYTAGIIEGKRQAWEYLIHHVETRKHICETVRKIMHHQQAKAEQEAETRSESIRDDIRTVNRVFFHCQEDAIDQQLREWDGIIAMATEQLSDAALRGLPVWDYFA